MARRAARFPRGRHAGMPNLPILPSFLARHRRPSVDVGKALALPAPAAKAAPPRPRRRSAGARTAGRWLRSSWTGPAGSRAYDIYLPAGHRRTTRVPLVLLLHGCDQTADTFVAATRFTALADRHGFVVVAPRQSRVYQPGGCWRWYDAAHQLRGAGEPAVLAGLTAAVLAEAVRWRIDPARVYAAGLSAGAAMALILGATYPDVFAAVGVHSGPAYRSATSGRGAMAALGGRGAPAPLRSARIPPLIVFQGVADRVVDARNGDQVTRQWLETDAARGADGGGRPVTRSRATVRQYADGRRATVTRWYTALGRKRLEYWRIDGLGHAWSGGLRDASYSDPRGPNASALMWRFFLSHKH
jgi:poly(hydroxyalkanoate) depolymerase family esterase